MHEHLRNTIEIPSKHTIIKNDEINEDLQTQSIVFDAMQERRCP